MWPSHICIESLSMTALFFFNPPQQALRKRCLRNIKWKSKKVVALFCHHEGGDFWLSVNHKYLKMRRSWKITPWTRWTWTWIWRVVKVRFRRKNVTSCCPPIWWISTPQDIPACMVSDLHVVYLSLVYLYVGCRSAFLADGMTRWVFNFLN